MAAGAQNTVMEALGGAHMNKGRKCLTIVRLNARVQKYNLTAANYGLNCSKYYVIRYNMYAPTYITSELVFVFTH